MKSSKECKKDDKQFRRELREYQRWLRFPSTPAQRAGDARAILTWCDHQDEKNRDEQRQVLAEWASAYMFHNGSRPPETAIPVESFTDQGTMQVARWVFIGTETALGAATAMQILNLPPFGAILAGMALTAVTCVASESVLTLIRDDSRPRETLMKTKRIAFTAFFIWLAGLLGLILVTRGAAYLGSATDVMLGATLTVLTIATPVLAASVNRASRMMGWANPYAVAYRTYAERLSQIRALRSQIPHQPSLSNVA